MQQAISSVMGAKAWLMLLTLSFVWGGSFYFNAVLVKELGPTTIVFFRVAIAALFLWLYIAIKRINVPRNLSAWIALGLMGLLNNVLPFGLIVWSQTIIPSSLASILNATVPMFTVLLAALFLNDEKITRLKILGVSVGFTGAAFIIAPDIDSLNGKHLLAQLAVLAAAISYSFAGIFGRRFSRMNLHPVTTAAGQVSASAILTLPFVFIIDQPSWSTLPSTHAITALVTLAIACTAFAYILYFRILAVAGATNLMLVTFLIPVWASILGVVLLGESFDRHQLAGVVVIALGLSLIDGRMWNRSR